MLNPERLKDVVAANPQHGGRKILMGLNTGFRKYGQSGLVVGDWWQHVGACADDIAVVRSLWTTDNDHGAQLQWHTGRHVREGRSSDHRLVGHLRPGHAQREPAGVRRAGRADRRLLRRRVDARRGLPRARSMPASGSTSAAKEPLPFVAPAAGHAAARSRSAEFGLLGRLNRLAGIDYPDDPALRARIKAYELAFGMQTAVPETLEAGRGDRRRRRRSTAWTRTRRDPSASSAWRPGGWSSAGVRFVQIFHGGGGGGAWDAHAGISANHGQLSAQVDLPIAGLLRDLKQRGMLDETIVVWGTEFGRSPGAQGDGRDHHPQGFCAWLAGGGIKGGVVHGATDEIGFHAVEDRHYVTDIHATVLHQLGLDPRKLEVPGRKRLEIDYGQPIRAIIA